MGGEPTRRFVLMKLGSEEGGWGQVKAATPLEALRLLVDKGIVLDGTVLLQVVAKIPEGASGREWRVRVLGKNAG